ncbi:MAG: 30S ribosomal protein S6 [Firmicutes bacterium]|nr:30S ribosomal protein S6 [Bacillota bacterium]
MKKYELIFVTDASLENEVIDEAVAKFTDLIKTNATIVEATNWGKRKLAYEVNKKWDGFYTLIQFEGPADFIKELERVLRIDERVMKFLVIKVDEKKIAQAEFYAQKRREREAARSARFAAERAAANQEATERAAAAEKAAAEKAAAAEAEAKTETPSEPVQETVQD